MPPRSFTDRQGPSSQLTGHPDFCHQQRAKAPNRAVLTLRLQPSNYRSRKGKQGLKTVSPRTLLSWLLWELGLQQTAPHPARTCKASTSHTPFQAAAR